MKKALFKDSLKEITKNFKRFISILLIVLLGVGFFAGIKATSPDMKLTLDEYFDEKNVYDVQVISTLGITEEDIEALKKVDGVENVNGSYSSDAIVNVGDEEIETTMKYYIDVDTEFIEKETDNALQYLIDKNIFGVKLPETQVA